MGIPILKVGLTIVRSTLRPINNMLMKRCCSVTRDGSSYRLFVFFWNKCNQFETHLDRMKIGRKEGLATIADLHPQLAF
jgi:mannose/fructose/N-acetylgalactosamine-specific phosphotransferase system component IID